MAKAKKLPSVKFDTVDRFNMALLLAEQDVPEIGLLVQLEISEKGEAIVSGQGDAVAALEAKANMKSGNLEREALSVAKRDALSSLNIEMDEFTAPFRSKYSQTEQALFQAQSTEARGVKAGTLTPEKARLLGKLAQGKSTDVPALADKIVAKADFDEDMSLAAIEFRDAAEAALQAVTSMDMLSSTIDDLRQSAKAMQTDFISRAGI